MRTPPLLCFLGLFVVVVLGTAVRGQLALGDPHFDAEDPTGMLVTDPGLLYYLTERTVEGGVPRPDPLLGVDALTEFTYGQELLVRAVRPLVPDMPLHVLCVWLFALVMALTAVAVHGLTREVTRSQGWALGAALWFALLPATYRTVGFVLMREDLSLPLFAGHLWLAARAVRVQTLGAGILAGGALGLALATWHAMGGIVLLEGLVLLVAAPRALANRVGVAALCTVSLVCLLAPVLWARGAVAAPELLLLWGLVLLGTRVRRVRRIVLGLTLLGSVVRGLALGLYHDMSHVRQLAWAKVSQLGVRPSNPLLLDPEARMMWQGPFSTTTVDGAWEALGIGLALAGVLLAVAVLGATLGRLRGLERVLVVGLFLSLAAGWMLQRLLVLPGLLLPVVLARAVQRTEGREPSPVPGLAFVALTFFQAISFTSWASEGSSWYARNRPLEVRAALEAVAEQVPAGEPVVTDFMLGTALLSAQRRPLLLSPKWESAGARARVLRFWEVFYHQDPVALRELCVGEWGAGWLLVDRATLAGSDARYLAGLRVDEEPAPGTCAALMLQRGPAAEPPGTRLLWSGPEPGAPRFRLYALD